MAIIIGNKRSLFIKRIINIKALPKYPYTLEEGIIYIINTINIPKV